MIDKLSKPYKREKDLSYIFESERLSNKSLDDALSILERKYNYKRIGKKELLLDDDENRYYGAKIILENKIIADKLVLQNSTEIIFRNCVFLKGLFIASKTANMEEIKLDNVIVKPRFYLSNISRDITVSLHQVNTKRLSIWNMDIKWLQISICFIHDLNLENNILKRFSCSSNRFNFIRIADCNIDETDFSYLQVNYKLFHCYYTDKFKKPLKNYNIQQFIDSSDYWKNIPANRIGDIFNTFEFLISKTKINSNIQYLNSMRYTEEILMNKNRFIRLLIRSLGAFRQPSKIILWSLAINLIFTLIYTLPFMQFILLNTTQPISGLNISNAIYLSISSFISVAYGDILPLGISKILVVSQGYMGILFTGAFLVALTRKYLSK